MVNAHEFTFPRLGGGAPISLREFAGRAVLLVNVASACGFTPQYNGLQDLHDAKERHGLTVLGAPCNDFGRQEPGDDAAIAGFCSTTYGVTFPMTGKIEIVTPTRHPFYEWVLTTLGEGALPKWNFHKFLIGKSGELAGSFGPSVTPLGPEMLGGVKAALDA
jgi:glutathione peroxidase